MEKKKLLIMDPAPTSFTYKLLYFLKDYFDITMVSLSIKYNKKIYEDLGIKIHSFNFQGERLLRDKKFIKGAKEVMKFLWRFFILKFKRFDFVLARTEPNLIGYFLFHMFPLTKKIYFPYDITFFRYKNPEKRRSKLDLEAEKYCFRVADFILHKGPLDELNLIRKDEAVITKGKPIQFLPYCFDNWYIPMRNEKDKLKDGIHLVYTGGLYYNFKGAGEKLAADPRYKLQWYDVFKEIGKQKIHVHAYSLDPVLDISDKYVHMYHDLNLEPHTIIWKYHYGIHIFFHNMEDLDPRWLKTSVANKLFSYLEAGIPIIINDELTYMAELVKKYNCGIVISEKDIPNLKKIIEKQNYPKLLEGVKKAREELKMSKHVKRLIKELGVEK